MALPWFISTMRGSDRSVAPTISAAVAAAAAAGTGLTGPGLVDRQPTAPVLVVVQGVDGRLGGMGVVHLDEPEAPAAAGLTVLDDLGADDLAVVGEQCFKIGTGGLERQVPDVQLLQDSLFFGNESTGPNDHFPGPGRKGPPVWPVRQAGEGGRRGRYQKDQRRRLIRFST